MGQREERKPPEIASAEVSSAETEFLKIILPMKNKKSLQFFFRRKNVYGTILLLNLTISNIEFYIYIVENISHRQEYLLITAVLQSTIDLIDSQQRAVTPPDYWPRVGYALPVEPNPARWAKSWRSKWEQSLSKKPSEPPSHFLSNHASIM